MHSNFKICPEHDIRLLPFSPVSESDILEVRVQGYNDGDDAAVEIVFRIDDEIIEKKCIEVKRNSYGFAKCNIPMTGKAGKHTVYVNEIPFSLDVIEKSVPVLDGGFAIIGSPNDRTATDTFRSALKSFSDEDWKNYIEKLACIGCKCIVFHNCQEYMTLYDENNNPVPGKLCAHYNSKIYPKSDIKANDPVEAVLEISDKIGINVFLSVGNCYYHTSSDEDFYEMFEKYGKYKSFYGWYLSNELNLKKFNFNGWEILRHQAEIIREISPVKPILVSPFDFPGNDVIEYMKTNDFFDIMMPQDCVGQERLNIEQSADMHRRLKAVCDLTGKHLWANCEAFNFKDKLLVPRYKNGGMNGENGFLSQIKTVRPYVEKILNFAYTGFFTPPDFAIKAGGDLAVKQFEEYRKYYDETLKLTEG